MDHHSDLHKFSELVSEFQVCIRQVSDDAGRTTESTQAKMSTNKQTNIHCLISLSHVHVG